MKLRLADRHRYAILSGQYMDAPTWENAIDFVARHFSNGGGGHYAIFKYPVGSRAWYARWIIVRTA
jgi:hypothetical protein